MTGWQNRRRSLSRVAWLLLVREKRVRGLIAPSPSAEKAGQVLAMAVQTLEDDPICRHPNARYPRRELLKRTLTYPERLLVKCVLTNLRFNESTAQRHNRNGYWSSVPREAAPIRLRLESKWGLKLHSSVGWWWPQYMTASPCGAENTPVLTPGHCRRMTRAYWLATL